MTAPKMQQASGSSQVHALPVQGAAILAPLRVPGQSIAREIEQIKEEKMEMYALLTAALFMILLTLWLIWSYEIEIKLDNPIIPIVICVSIVPAVLYFSFIVFWFKNGLKKRSRMRQLCLDYRGKVAVGEELESLRSRGYEVLHDLRGSGFGIDHLVIAPNGIFIVETQAGSTGGAGAIEVAGGSILQGGEPLEKDVVLHAKVHAGWLHEQIRNGIACEYPVRPIIVFPEAQVKGGKAGAHGEAVVLNPSEIGGYIERTMLGERVLLREEMNDLVFFLATVARNQ